MNLFLKHGKKLSSISDVTLKDFHIPSVGVIEIDHPIEPAIWFKTLIIDSLYIECDVRNVYWREKSASRDNSSEFDTESTRLVPRMTRAVYEEGDSEDFELFDAVIKLLQRIESKSINESERAQEILRILHLYVLPEIVLNVNDVPSLHDVLDDVEVRIQRLSCDIEAKDRGIFLTETSLRNQRDKLFTSENFESETYLSTCNVDFLLEVLTDVERDITSLNYDLESKQAAVERLRNAVTGEGQSNLHKLREERDKLFEAIKTYQSVREAIKNVTVRNKNTKRKKKGKDNVFHEIYLELKGRLLKEKQIVKQVCDHKLKITSVREAIVQVSTELLQKGESYGFESSRDGSGASTDVLEASQGIKPPNWQTVEDKVKTTLYEGTSPISEAFNSFCDSILTKIDAFMKENELFMKSRDEDETETKLKTDSDDADEFVNISYLESINIQLNAENDVNRLSSGYRPFTAAIKEDIQKHIEDQSHRLLSALDLSSYKDKGKVVNVELPHKIWICYESHLYGRIFKPLSRLYLISYSESANKLFDFVSKLELIDLDVDEPWLREDYIPDEHAHKASGEMDVKKAACASLKSGLSITLGRMTLDELYQSAKNDCDDIPSFIDCPFDDDDNDDSPDDKISPSSNDGDKGISFSGNTFEHQDFKIKEVMYKAILEVDNCIQSASVIEKFKHLTKTYRLVTKSVGKLKKRRRTSSVQSMVCCDEILSASIVLLTFLKKEQFVHLYAHLNFLIDLMPTFLTGSLHDCSLTNFYSSFQYMFDKQTVMASRISR